MHESTRYQDGLPTMLDALLEGMQLIDFGFRYLYVNAAAARHGKTQPEALVGRTMMECYPGIEQTAVFAELRHCLTQREAVTLENEFHHADGTTSVFELRMEPVPQGACVLSIDISARKQAEARLRQAEERLRHAERMEAVGMLAAGIAHDFNNLLSVMLGYGELALLRPGGPRAEDVRGIVAAAQRSADLTRQLLAYGKRQVMKSEIVDAVALIRELEAMLRRTLDADVELRVHAAPGVGCVEVDPTKLEQVVMNLVLNARDAIAGSGTISIDIREQELDAGYVREHPGAHLGSNVVISVSDTGLGMDAATRARIFEPFFTTKAQGRGTGLGLATVYGIVKQNEGDIWVYSEPGQGTTFKVYFPRSTHDAAPCRKTPEAAPAHARPRLGESVLVAEDDALLRKLAEDTLVAAGYRVLLAASGDEALRLCASRRPISLLVTDVVMPGLRGPELIEAARRLRPTLPVLCTSGYAAPTLKGQHAMPEDVVFLEKPYLPSVLVRTVHELLACA